MSNTFDFTCSPLLRDVPTIPLPLAFSSVPATPESLDGGGTSGVGVGAGVGVGTMSRDTGFGGMGSFPFGLTSLANGTLGQE